MSDGTKAKKAEALPAKASSSGVEGTLDILLARPAGNELFSCRSCPGASHYFMTDDTNALPHVAMSLIAKRRELAGVMEDLQHITTLLQRSQTTLKPPASVGLPAK